MRIYPRGKRGILWVDTTIDGQRIKRSSGTTERRKAEEWAAKITSDTWRVKKLGDTPTVTWGQAVLDWMQKHGAERRSVETMKERLRWITPRIEHEPLTALTRRRVETLMRQKESEDSAGPATLNRYVAEVSKILHHAHRMEWIPAVPAFRRYKETKGKVAWLTPEQADALLAELPEHLERMARFTLATGLREANVRRLQWKQVDLGRRMAWVESTDTKQGKALAVPLNQDALDVLYACRSANSRYVFTWTDPLGHTGPVTGCSTAAWYKALKRAGLDGFRWHDLRHTWASWHVQNGTPLQVLQQLGGWSSYSMVLRYAHLGRDHVSAYADAVLRFKSGTSLQAEETKTPQVLDSMGWLMGLEPTTTGITILQGDSTALKPLRINPAKRRKTA